MVGGTALLWRPEVGKTDAIESYSHRDCGRTFAGYELWSVYGYAHKAEPAWVRTIILIGDWSWKPFHHRALTSTWKVADTLSTVIGAAMVAPTRCVLSLVDPVEVDTVSIIGIPHHLGGIHELAVSVPLPARKTRLRKCSVTVWNPAPRKGFAPSVKYDLREAADRAQPK